MLLAIASDDAAKVWINDTLAWQDTGLSSWRLDRFADRGRLHRRTLGGQLEQEDATGEQDRQADADREQQQGAGLHRRWSLRERFGNVGSMAQHSPSGLGTFVAVMTRLRHRTQLAAAVLAQGGAPRTRPPLPPGRRRARRAAAA